MAKKKNGKRMVTQMGTVKPNFQKEIKVY